MKILYVISFWLVAALSFILGMIEGLSFVIWEGIDVVNDWLMKILMNLNKKINGSEAK